MDVISAILGFVVAAAGAWWLMYWPSSRRTRVLATRTIYRYLPTEYVIEDGGDVVVEPRPQSWAIAVGLPSGAWTFFYVGHRRRGALLNHTRPRARQGSVIEIDGSALLEVLGDVDVRWRRWDSAIAIPVTYRGPGHVLHGVDPYRARKSPQAPTTKAQPTRTPW